MPVVETPDARIFYTRAGHGSPVILVQGVGVIGEGWRPQIDALAVRHTVIAVDNRGIGRSTTPRPELTIESMANDVFAVIGAEGIERFHLVGHSMGGIIAQQVALSAPSRVLSLSLLCTFLRGSQGASVTLPLLVTALRARIGTRRMRRRAFLEIVMPRPFLATVDRDALCDRLKELFGHDLADQPSIVMRQLGAMKRFDASSRLEALAGIPTLVLSAEEDRIARPAFGRALAAAIPGARYVEWSGGGHAVTIQCAAGINAILREHLGRVAPAAAT